MKLKIVWLKLIPLKIVDIFHLTSKALPLPCIYFRIIRITNSFLCFQKSVNVSSYYSPKKKNEMRPLSRQVSDKICTNSSSSSITKPRRFRWVVSYENNLHLNSPIHYQSSTILTLIYAPTSIMHQGRGSSENKRTYRWLVLDGFESVEPAGRRESTRWQMPHGTSKMYAFFIATQRRGSLTQPQIRPKFIALPRLPDVSSPAFYLTALGCILCSAVVGAKLPPSPALQ